MLDNESMDHIAWTKSYSSLNVCEIIWYSSLLWVNRNHYYIWKRWFALPKWIAEGNNLIHLSDQYLWVNKNLEEIQNKEFINILFHGSVSIASCISENNLHFQAMALTARVSTRRISGTRFRSITTMPTLWTNPITCGHKPAWLFVLCFLPIVDHLDWYCALLNFL